MLLKRFILGTFIIIYFIVFSFVNTSFQSKNISLQMGLPATFQQVFAGYLSQVTSEILFIKTIVFLGGLRPGTPENTYSAALSNNFEIMTSLYPEFIDPYYFCQSFLAPISKDSAQSANHILRKGIETYPNDFMLRFFYAFNFYRFLNNPIKSAEAFLEASKIPDAPPLFGYLAAIFSTEKGNIQAGLISLKTMLAIEQDKNVKARYQKEIDTFERILLIENAISLFTRKYSSPPGKLEDLVPEFLKQLPKISNNFKLIYEPPVLRLERH